MGTSNWTATLLITTSIALLALASPYDDYSDLRGPYCQNRGCCDGRKDECSVPILGTLCYCDDFCNITRVDDCCPDYWSHCKGLIFPTRPPRVPTTTRAPEQSASCTWQGRNIFFKSSVKDNCNICTCEKTPGREYPEMLCETNTCIVDSRIIDSVNSNSDYGWTAGNHSEFWGRTLNDGIIYRLGTLQPHRIVMRMNPVRRIYDPHSLPRSFDAVTKWPGWILDVQDQGWCGSSWAMSTVAVASDRYAILSKGIEHVELSAQNLLSCDIKGQQSCNGGYLDRAWAFFRKYGLVDEDCFPYVAKNEKCTIKKYGNLLDSRCDPPPGVDRKSRYRVGPAYRLGNETDIMYEIINSGPVQATMKVYHDFFQYREGIYRHTDLSITDNAGYHSVRIVGWGEEYSFKGLQKYWKVANSWGPNWGDRGYFHIARGTNECDIESFVLGVWPEIEKKVLIRDGFYNDVTRYRN